MLEFTNVFHTLCMILGIKDFEKHLVLKYHGFIQKYIQDEMESPDISSLGMIYRYTTKIKQNFKQKRNEVTSYHRLKESRYVDQSQNQAKMPS